VLATTPELNEQTSMPVEVVEEVVRAHASGARSTLSPMAAAYGGIVGQEVIKALTGKFMPFFQFLYMDFVECLADEDLDDEEYKIGTPSRYDHQIQVFGKSFQERLMAQNYFLVGAGALGCEFLKNFAMVGLGCGSDGKVTVTDDDVIEKSNLSRQFLFRNWHIHKSKAEVLLSLSSWTCLSRR
jgi:ubiquitin-activating enzyme E1